MSDENERSVASTGSVSGYETVPDPDSRIWETYSSFCHVSSQKNLTLTDAEREAAAWCRDNITAMAHPSSAFAHIHAATLRGLLERLR